MSRLEAWLESVFEGGFRRLFPVPLQPAEVARAVERAMMRARMVGTGSVDVPNRFTVRVHPTDFERLAARGGAVEQEAAAYADQRADEEGVRPVGPLTVTLVADPAVRRAAPRLAAAFCPRSDLPTSLEHTRRLALVETGRPILIISSADGREVVATQRGVRIGRGTDNDLIIRDLRVSRHHAVIEPGTGGWLVRDVGSTNGTWVGGQRIAHPTSVGVGSVSLGGYELELRTG